MLYSNRNRPLTVRCFREITAGSADVCNHARAAITVMSLENAVEKEEEMCDRRGVFKKMMRWSLCENSYLNLKKRKKKKSCEFDMIVDRWEMEEFYLSNPRGDKTRGDVYTYSAFITRAFFGDNFASVNRAWTATTGYSLEILRATLVIAAVNNSSTNNSPQNSRLLLTRCALFFPGELHITRLLRTKRSGRRFFIKFLRDASPLRHTSKRSSPGSRCSIA